MIDPVILFFGIWLGVFALYALDNSVIHLFYYYGDIGSYATRLFAESFVSFFVGGFVAAGLVSFSKHKRIRGQASVILDKESKQWDMLLLCTKRLTLIYFAAVIVKYALLVGTYGGNPLAYLYEIRIEKSLSLHQRSFPIIFGFQNVLGNLIFLNLGVLLSLSKKRSVRNLTLLMLIFAFLDDATTADKGSVKEALFLVFTWLITSYLLEFRRFQIRTYVKPALVFVVFLLFLSSITYFRVLPGWSDLTKSAPWSGLAQGNPLSFATVWHFYNNIVGNIPSTASMFDYPASSVYPGDNTLMDIYKFLDTLVRAVFGTGLFPNGYWIVKVVEYQPYLARYGIFNTVSHLGYYYSDFGEAGVIVLSFLLGFFTSYFYKKAILSKRLSDIQRASMLMAAIVYTIRSVLYGGVNFWLTFLVIGIQHKMLQRARRRLDTSS